MNRFVLISKRFLAFSALTAVTSFAAAGPVSATTDLPAVHIHGYQLRAATEYWPLDIPVDVAPTPEPVMAATESMNTVTTDWEYLVVVDPSTSTGWLTTAGGYIVSEFAIAVGIGGLSSIPGSDGTPTGALAVSYAVNGELNEILAARRPTGRFATIGEGKGAVTTAALVLHGLEPGNATSRARNIYIHGTQLLDSLGKGYQSSGCVRVAPDIALQLAAVAKAHTTAVYILDRPWTDETHRLHITAGSGTHVW